MGSASQILKAGRFVVLDSPRTDAAGRSRTLLLGTAVASYRLLKASAVTLCWRLLNGSLCAMQSTGPCLKPQGCSPPTCRQGLCRLGWQDSQARVCSPDRQTGLYHCRHQDCCKGVWQSKIGSCLFGACTWVLDRGFSHVGHQIYTYRQQHQCSQAPHQESALARLLPGTVPRADGSNPWRCCIRIQR
eukprot:5895-Heterococcus_DN1.PRE.1